MSTKDGGPAFPVLDSNLEDGRQGMSLLDWFAGQALKGELASQSSGAVWPERTYQLLASRCYAAAAAMILERAKEKP